MKTKTWFLLVILGLGLFLRWWHLADWFHFTMDEELIAWRAWGLFQLNRPFLIGGISPLQIHLPPYFYYFSSFLLWPFRLDPIGWGWWAGLFSLVTIWLLYKISRSLIATLLYSVSLTTVMFDRHYWPLFFNPPFVLLILWALNKKRYFILILVLVLAVTADPSNLTLGLFVLIYNYRALKYWWLGAGLFMAPLLAFDLRHNWQNFAGFGRLFTNISNQTVNWNSLLLLPQSLTRFWYTGQTNLLEVYSYCIPYAQARLANISPWLLIAAIFVIVIAIKQNRSMRLLLLAYFIGLSVFGFLGFSLFDHYLTGLMPIWAMITALVLRRLPKSISLVALLIFLAVNLYQFSRVNNPYGLSQKKSLVKWANLYLADSDWALESTSKCHRENGLRYLFELSGNPPGKSFMDENFAWLYSRPPTLINPDKILLVTDKPLAAPGLVMAQQKFGAFNAYLLKNEN